MIGSQKKNLKEEILEILLQGPASSKKIRSILLEKNIEVSIQGIYKQLNTLLESNVILKNKQTYSVSNEWIKEASKIIDVQEIELPEEGEKFTYKFNSLQKLDEHWKHVMSSFRKKYKNEAFFSYCPHQIWIYVPNRSDSEIQYKNEHEEEKYYNFYTIGGNTDLDKKFKKLFQGDYYRIENLEISGVKREVFLSTFGTNIIKTSIDKKLSAKIDSIYNENSSNKEKESALREILSKPHKCTFSIENNKKKSLLIKKKISKPFYLPEHIRAKLKQQSL